VKYYVNFRKAKVILLASLLLLVGCAGASGTPTPPANEPDDGESPSDLIQFGSVRPGDTLAVMETSMGTILVRLFPQYAPITVENFVGLAEEGFFDGRNFHRVINDFMIQGGALNPDGAGGTSIFKDDAGNPQPFVDEFSEYLWHFRGALSMANPGMRDSNLSQFFIVQNNDVPEPLADQMRTAGFPEEVVEQYMRRGGTPHLDGGHTVFGQVIEGMAVVDAIAAVPTGANDRPVDDVLITSVTIQIAE